MGRQLLLLLSALLALSQAGLAVAGTQHATPGGVTGCTVAPRSAENLLALGSDADGTPRPARPSSLNLVEEADFPPGEPADAATVAAIDAVAQAWVACVNAGDLPRLYALLTDDLARRRDPHTLPPADEIRAVLTAPPVPLAPETRWAIGPAHEARILKDGRVGAAFVWEQAGIAHNVFIVFEHETGRWRLDEMDRFAALEPMAPVWGYRVVDEYPHDPDAYTQGLVFIDGVLYEGTGLEGESTLRRVDLETGEVRQSRALAPGHFGEGIAIVGDRIYQLTWRTETCFVYDRETFDLLETFTYSTEGWGLTTDGERLVMSDGSSRLVFRDPDTFAALGHVDVRDGGMPVSSLNELEDVDGEIWANVYQTDRIARIDPATGQVTGWIDLTGLLSSEDRQDRSVDVLNGIAYDAESGRIFVTGKNWPKLFEIEVVPPA